MTQAGMHTLAAGWLETLAPLIVAALWIIGSVAKALQDQKKKAGAPPRGPAEGTPRPARGDKSVEERLREIAEYRRRQMESGGQAAAPVEPAAAPQRGRADLDDDDAAERAAAERRREAARRREAQRRRQAEARREAEARRCHAEALRQREQQAAAEAERQRASRRARAKAEAAARQAPEAARTAMPISTQQPGDHETVHRHVPDAETPASHPRQLAMKLTGLNRAALRQAIVLKEVLDRPLALRDPLALPFEP